MIKPVSVVPVGNTAAQSVNRPNQAPVPGIAHLMGLSALVVAGFGVPAVWLISGGDKIDTADKWVLRGVAATTAVIAAPLAAHYLDRLRRQGGQV